MASFGQKKKITEYLYSKPSIAVLLIIVGLLSVAVYQRYTVEREVAARREATQQEQEALKERKVQLEERVEHLSGDRGIEEEIRRHFDVAKDGEQVVIIVDREEEEGSIPLPPPPPPKPWYQFW